MLKQLAILTLLSGTHMLAMAAPADATTSASDTAATSAGSSTDASASATSSGAADPSATSGALAGPDGTAKCTDLKSYSRADWLVTALCAISKCNHMWPMANIGITSGDIYKAAEAKFTTYDLNLKSVTTVVKYADARKDPSDNASDSWFGGGFDRAVEKMGGPGINDGKLMKNDDANSTAVEDAGRWGLTYLTGQFAVREDIPEDVAAFTVWMKKVDGTPVLIRTNDAPDGSLTKNQYYTVTSFDQDKKIAKLWDPLGDGDDAYVELAVDKLKSSCKYLYHLDWPHFFYNQ
ncbi:hypothetical protein IAT38_005010 [Cryptococcus sp. DSM 104549]